MKLEMILLVIGSVIVLVLATIAGRLVLKVIQMNARHKQQLMELEQANNKAVTEQREQANKSIQILAKALHNAELTPTEASIRISHLLDQLDVQETIKEEFSAFYQLRKATEHIPFLQAWQQLSDKEQRQFDKERLQHEAVYFDFVMDAARRIESRQF